MAAGRAQVGEAVVGVELAGAGDGAETAAHVAEAGATVEGALELVEAGGFEELGVPLAAEDDGPAAVEASLGDLGGELDGADGGGVADGDVVGGEDGVEVDEAVEGGEDEDLGAEVGGEPVGGLAGGAVEGAGVELAGGGGLGELGGAAGDDDDGPVEVLGDGSLGEAEGGELVELAGRVDEGGRRAGEAAASLELDGEAAAGADGDNAGVGGWAVVGGREAEGVAVDADVVADLEGLEELLGGGHRATTVRAVLARSCKVHRAEAWPGPPAASATTVV